jgi:outer membrane PBP1 activator LpoA protein
MLGRWIKTKLIAGVVAGLYLSGCANTSLQSPQYPSVTVPQSAPAAAAGMPQQGAVTESVLPPAVDLSAVPAVVFPPMPATVRVAVVLPLLSPTLGRAAKAVQNGFMVAHAADRRNIIVDVVQTGDAPQDVLNGYLSAASGADIIVGPMSRTGVMAIIQSNSVVKPTIALAQPELQGLEATVFPPAMVMAALSIEDEARQMADRIAAERPAGPVFIVSTPTSWQRRTARAFMAQATLDGLQTEAMEIGVVSGFLDGNDLAELRKRIRSEKPALVFVALDFDQARQLRAAIGTDVPLFGTSQLNPLALADWSTAEPAPELNGTQLLDIPWQLQPDHPAVMAYPRLVPNTDLRRSAAIERLYALGIDAYRIALEIAANRTQFAIDGVTGKLTVRLGTGATAFQRIQQPAEYRDGIVVPVTDFAVTTPR